METGPKVHLLLLLVSALSHGSYGQMQGEENTHHKLALNQPPFSSTWSYRECQGETAKLYCGGARTIHLGDMFWGRLNQGACIGENLNTDSTTCEYSGVRPASVQQCQGKSECEIQLSPDSLGIDDPCPDVHKVFEISYECRLETHSAYICEDGALEISCDGNQVMKIYDAFYGRDFGGYCNTDNDPNLPTDCSSPSGLVDKVGALCDGLNSCTVRVNNAYLGDTCVGVSKYLSVNYVCDECDNLHGNDAECLGWAVSGECDANPSWMNSQCTKGCWGCGKNNVGCDDEAAYADICPWWASRGECQLNTEWMSSYCPHSCRTCEPRSRFVAEEGVDYTAQVCEGRWVYTNCGESDLVLEINDVFFGRMDNTTCPHESVLTTNCPRPAGMLSKARNLCNGLPNCYLGADSWQWDDPCPGTYKYLTLDHQCRKCENVFADATCESLKSTGQCEASYENMMTNCFATCTGCAYSDCPNMYGEDQDCDRWAPSGECEANPDMMKEQCKRSCGLCSPDPNVDDTCINWMGTSFCENWAGQNECVNNPFWMRQYCPKACGMCDKDACVNKNVNCVYWASLGQCGSNASFMMSNCKRACTDCAGDAGQCVNALGSDVVCERWAAEGACQTSADSMNLSCAKACNTCQ